jgi:hypothetical protein
MEWIEFGKSFGEFQQLGLAKPGVLLDTPTFGLQLIGHMNEGGGFCDCCQSPRDLVSRYKTIYEFSADNK